MLVFIFQILPGDPSTSSMLIILSVITAASTMQSVGGIDYLVEVAKKILKRNPAYITIVIDLVWKRMRGTAPSLPVAETTASEGT